MVAGIPQPWSIYSVDVLCHVVIPCCPPLVPPQRTFYTSSLGAMQRLYADASHVVTMDDMLMANLRSRWVTANPSRHEYAQLAQRRPNLPQR